MSMVCGLDLHRGQVTFDAQDVASGEAWRGRIWQPDRPRVRRWLREELGPRADGEAVAVAVESCTGWRLRGRGGRRCRVRGPRRRAADIQAARGPKHGKRGYLRADRAQNPV
jgi:transposase